VGNARIDVSPELAAAYEEIHRLTHEACKTCPNKASTLPYRCCDPIACENARKWAALKGVALQETGHPTLPFMGSQGCVLALDVKPLCTMHHCTNLNGHPHYLELKYKIEELEGADWQKYIEVI
jgi:hypothetical protein